IARVGLGAESNGVAVPPAAPAARPWRLPVPWWALTLFAGIVLVGTAAWLELQRLPGSVPLFLLAALGILAGLVGLGLDYFREKKRLEGEEEEPTAPRIHRKAVCQVDQPLLDKLARAVEV